jgi:YD repeat-containing protein
MPRVLEVNGERWEVAPTGWVTQYTRDEFGLMFTLRRPEGTIRRIVRYSPLGSRSSEDSLAELSGQQLRDLWEHSQPSWTAPETEYQR